MQTSNELTDFVAQVAGAHNFRVQESLGEGLVRLNMTEAQQRQAMQDIQSVEDALVELLRNARDAHATTIYVASSKNQETRELVVIDDGDGVPLFAHELIFEPRVTSKLIAVKNDAWGIHGRGMALFSIKTRAQEAYLASSAPGRGTAVVARFDTHQVTERSDQSSWPVLSPQEHEEKIHALTGPHNLIRSTVELALEQHDYEGAYKLYIGSPLEIVATMLHKASKLYSMRERMDVSQMIFAPLPHRMVYAADANELCDISAQLGLHISLRSAQRVLAGEIRPLYDVLTQLSAYHRIAHKRKKMQKTSQAAPHHSALLNSCSDAQFKPSQEELLQLKSSIQAALERLGEAHYHQLDDDIDVSCRQGELVIRARYYSDENR